MIPKSQLAPLARIMIRYGAGAIIGSDAAGILAHDPDIITFAAAGLVMAVEAVYVLAKRRGWAT